MASIMGKGAWWSVPLAVLIGIPVPTVILAMTNGQTLPVH